LNNKTLFTQLIQLRYRFKYYFEFEDTQKTIKFDRYFALLSFAVLHIPMDSTCPCKDVAKWVLCVLWGTVLGFKDAYELIVSNGVNTLLNFLWFLSPSLAIYYTPS